MRVIISCMGKFHAFNLAEQLNQNGYLYKFLTTYYSRKNEWLKLRKDTQVIDLDKVITNIYPEILSKIINKIPFINRTNNWDFISLELFDRWAEKNIDNCDLFVGWSGNALNSIKFAKSKNIKTLLVRGSTHILFQKKILEEEYKKYDIKTRPINNKIIEKELLEYEEADYIYVPSVFAKETFIQHNINPNKIIQIPYGVNSSLFHKDTRDDDVFRIVFVGSLSLRKGVQYLLEAFSELNLKNAELVFIGYIDPDIKDILHKYENIFKFIGKVEQAMLYKYLSNSSVFVFPSLEEGLAQVILQAAACGLPVICTPNSGCEDVITDGREGFIVPIRDITALKEKILYLYEHKNERDSMSEMAFKKAQNLTWDIFGKRIITEYERITSKPK